MVTNDENVVSAAQRIAAERIGMAAPRRVKEAPAQRSEFEATLQRNLESVDQELSFSSHAIDRMLTRNLSLSSEQLERLSDAVARAGEKGAKESLVLVDNLAMIVSVTNRKVITAMDAQGMKDNVITNIDSAVIS